MIKQLVLSALACCTLVAASQQVTVVERTRLLKFSGEQGYYPVLSQDGSKVLYGGAASGLKMLDLSNNAVTTISSEAGAAFSARWGNDGKVYFVTQKQGDDRLIYRTGMRYDPSLQSSEVVLEAQHGAVLPVTGNRGTGLKAAKRSFASSDLGTSVTTQGSKLIITENGVTREVSPVESHAGYLWASVSPQADKIAFVAAETGVYVTDLKGNVLARLGRYEMPAWLDNDYIVVQKATDDGHQFTSSQIVLLKADGTFTHALTEPGSMTMQPTAGGGKIAYTTIDGLMHLMRIEIKE